MLVLIGAASHASAEVSPVFGLRTGAHFTDEWESLLDYFHEGGGNPDGWGPGIELEAGARFDPRWSARAFGGTWGHHTDLYFVHTVDPVMHFESRYRHLLVGAGVTLHPARRLYLDAGLGRLWGTQHNYNDRTSHDSSWSHTVLVFRVAFEVVRVDRVSVQVSIGIDANLPGLTDNDDHTVFTAPMMVGVVWD